MELPNGEAPIVEIEKLQGSCLSRHHSRGKHKARVFQSALGPQIIRKNSKRL
jgi:hypothetical protein